MRNAHGLHRGAAHAPPGRYCGQDCLRNRGARLRARADAGGAPQQGWTPPWSGWRLPFFANDDEYEEEYETEYDPAETAQPAAQSPAVVTGRHATAAAAATTAAEAEQAAPVQEEQDAAAQAVPTAQVSLPVDLPATASVAVLAPAEPAFVVPTPACTATATQPSGCWEASANGWVIACALLLAVRQGRVRAEEDRTDVRALQARQSESRVQSRELLEKRKEYLEREQAAKEAAAQQRVEAARLQAEQEARERAEREARYQQQQARETARVWAEQQAAKQAYQDQESQLTAELQRRTELELRLLEEEAVRRKQEQERLEREAAAAAAREAEARAAAERAAAQRAADERRRAEEAAAALRAQMTLHTLSVVGEAAAGPPAPGQLTAQEGPLGPQPARLLVELAVRMEGQPGVEATSSRAYESADAAGEDAPDLAALAAKQLAERCASHYAAGPSSDARGPLPLRPAELVHWMRLASLQVAAWGQLAVGQVAALAPRSRLGQPFQVECAYSALPPGHEQAFESVLARAARLAAAEQLAEAVEDLDALIARQQQDFSQFGRWQGPPLSEHLVPALVYARLLDLHDSRGGDDGDMFDALPTQQDVDDGQSPPVVGSSAAAAADDEAAAEADGSTRSGQVAGDGRARVSIATVASTRLGRLAAHQLQERTKRAPRDSLTSVSEALARVLGREHPVSVVFAALAEGNMSAAARQARELRRRQEELAVARRVLQANDALGVGPSGLDPSGTLQRQTLTPIPERTWALRNVANSMIRSGGQGQEEALRMLQEAADLCRRHYGELHPGQLGAYLDLVDGQRAAGDERAVQAAMRHVLRIVQAAGERYRQQNDLTSLVLLYEAAQREFDLVLPRNDPDMDRITRQAADAFSVLDTKAANRVMSRRKAPTNALRQLARDFTETLGVYQASKRSDTKLDQWNSGKPLSPL